MRFVAYKAMHGHQPRYISMSGQATAMLNHVVMSRTGNAVAERLDLKRLRGEQALHECS